jgi:hypothetical protein
MKKMVLLVIVIAGAMIAAGAYAGFGGLGDKVKEAVQGTGQSGGASAPSVGSSSNSAVPKGPQEEAPTLTCAKVNNAFNDWRETFPNGEPPVKATEAKAKELGYTIKKEPFNDGGPAASYKLCKKVPGNSKGSAVAAGATFNCYTKDNKCKYFSSSCPPVCPGD